MLNCMLLSLKLDLNMEKMEMMGRSHRPAEQFCTVDYYRDTLDEECKKKVQKQGWWMLESMEHYISQQYSGRDDTPGPLDNLDWSDKQHYIQEPHFQHWPAGDFLVSF